MVDVATAFSLALLFSLAVSVLYLGEVRTKGRDDPLVKILFALSLPIFIVMVALYLVGWGLAMVLRLVGVGMMRLIGCVVGGR